MDSETNMRALPSSTIRLIGSTQVITSVFSVIKELIENSLDAQATSIDIKLDEYGLEKIEVTDNGCGVKSSDVPLMVKRHFTSKLMTTEDLTRLETYGFRGEALASLCAVSSLTITTKRAEDDVSYMYRFGNNEDVLEKKPSHVGKGTTICARKLFSNLPVRKQYYSNDQRKKDDLKKIENLVMAYSFVRPSLRITLKHGKEVIFQKTALRDIKQVIHLVFGRQVANQMIKREKTLEDPKLSISAFLPKPGSDVREMSLSNADRTYLIVNGRPVYLPEMNRILRSYYSNCHDLENPRHPLCVVSFNLPIDEVDVNVDPNKTKVFLQNKTEVKKCLEEMLLEDYGPLDNVPLWHYADGDSHKDESTKDVKQRQHDHQQKMHPIMYRSLPDERLETACVNDVPKDSDPKESTGTNHPRSLPDEGLETACVNDVPKDSEPKESSGTNHPRGTVVDVTIVNQEALSSNSLSNVKSAVDVIQLDRGTEESDSHTVDSENNEIKASETSIELNGSNKTCAATNVSGGENNLNSISLVETTEISLLMDATEIPSLDPNSVESTRNESSSKINVINSEDKDECVKLVDTNTWTRGTLNLGDNSTLLQPVKLLHPSSNQVPGKRPLLEDDSSPSQPTKRKSTTQNPLPSNQSTLYEVLNLTSIKKPLSAFELFCQEKCSTHEAKGNNIDVDKLLKNAWERGSDKDKLVYREKCWNETKRYEREKKSFESKNKPRQASVRDEIASLASQSQAQRVKPKKKLKNRLYPKEVIVPCTLSKLKRIISKGNDGSKESLSLPQVIGQAKLCEAWLCSLENKLLLVNTHRLMEIDVLNRLKAEHILPSSLCEPIFLNSSTIGVDLNGTLEDLAKANQRDDMYFMINDKRLIANGFKVKCHFDSDGTLKMQLLEICKTIPTYGVSDIKSVLEILSQNPDAHLQDTRPNKVLDYLQGEAFRMVCQSKSFKSPEDIQDLLDRSINLLSQNCSHDKPIVHKLIDMSDLEVEDMLL